MVCFYMRGVVYFREMCIVTRQCPKNRNWSCEKKEGRAKEELNSIQK